MDRGSEGGLKEGLSVCINFGGLINLFKLNLNVVSKVILACSKDWGSCKVTFCKTTPRFLFFPSCIWWEILHQTPFNKCGILTVPYIFARTHNSRNTR